MTDSIPLNPADILLEIAPALADVSGSYRTISKEILVGQICVSAEQAEAALSWALSAKTFKIGDVRGIAPDVLKQHPVSTELKDALFAWLRNVGLPNPEEVGLVSALNCRAAPFHEDISGFGDSLFCVVWLGTEPGLELVFPFLEKRVPLTIGTCIVFDSAQPHGVLGRGFVGYAESDYGTLGVQPFISVDFPATGHSLQARMGIVTKESPAAWQGYVLDANVEGTFVNDNTGHWSLTR